MKIFTKKRITVFVLLVFCLLIVNAFFKDSLKNFVYSKSENLMASLWSGGSEWAFSNKNQEELNKKLNEDNQQLLSQLADYQKIREENDFLRNSLNLGLEKEFDLILGRVIAKDILSDSLLINVGSNNGVKKGFPVIVSGIVNDIPTKILLGKVVDVYPSYSRVMLITQKNNFIDVEIPDSEIFALSKGEGNLNLTLDMIARDKELKEGSLVLTSALGGNYPAGLLMGKVRNVKKIDNEAYQTADIEKVFDLSMINNVFVIKIAEIYND
jgi:rod shape-determining protein MreC